MFPYTRDNKRYHTLYYYNQAHFGGRVIKAGLDVGMTCPNRDGTCGQGGCIYCDNSSFSFAPPGTVTQQLQSELERIRRKYPTAKLNAYFQSGTNTYAPLERLRTLWEEALAFPEVAAVSVATRADCLQPEILNLLTELNRKTALTVELGLQTVHDAAAARINRGHDFAAFLDGYQALQVRGIRTCVHLINGLPGESREDMVESAWVLGRLRPGGVKLHLLYVPMHTALEQLWRAGRYQPMERQDYIAVICEQLRYFPPETVIERLTGDGDKSTLLAPLWSTDKRYILGGIDHYMAEHNYWQGDLFQV